MGRVHTSVQHIGTEQTMRYGIARVPVMKHSEEKRWVVWDTVTKLIVATLPNDDKDGTLATHIAALLSQNLPPNVKPE